MAEYVNKTLTHPTSASKSPTRVRSLDRISGQSMAYANTDACTSELDFTEGDGDTVASPFISPNQFEPLSDDDEGELPSASAQSKKPSKVRLPPIFIMDSTISDIFKLLKNCSTPQSEDFLLKRNKSSVQLLTKSKDVFDKTISTLKSKNVPFFTHGTSDNVPAKFVLSGLPLAELSKLKDELTRVNINPSDVKVLSTTKTSQDTYALYVLYFPRGSVKIQDLRKTKALFNVAVSWRFYEKRADDAAQCYRCQRFGHGSTNCNLAPKCVKCGGKHLTDGCTLPKKANLSSKQNDRSLLKCANCGANHTANFRGCPTRKAYLENLEKRKTKPVQRPPRMTNDDFPSLVGQGTALHRTSPNAKGRATYAQISANTPLATSANHCDENLFTISEFLCLARDMFARLSGCRTKEQQFFALSELMIKYLYHG